MSFKDHFSAHSGIYKKFRPLYPAELYSFLSSLTQDHKLCWDCGTGNGQAAVGLAAFYDKVIATDPSEEQIKNCIPHPKVEYRVERAESSSLKDHSADLLTIANALHWFDFDAFFTEAHRVVKKNGVIAAWAYGLPLTGTEVDTIAGSFHDDVIGSYWRPENKLVLDKYADLPFPFKNIEPPSFVFRKNMNLAETIGYFNTWSAVQKFINEKGYNPTEKLYKELQSVWGNEEEKKEFKWDLILKVGRIE